jgi:hypothetical protein
MWGSRHAVVFHKSYVLKKSKNKFFGYLYIMGTGNEKRELEETGNCPNQSNAGYFLLVMY